MVVEDLEEKADCGDERGAVAGGDVTSCSATIRERVGKKAGVSLHVDCTIRLHELNRQPK